AKFARERNARWAALVDDVSADFSEAINVRFARTKIAAFDRVIEQPINAVTIVLIIFRGVNSDLGDDGVGAARRILIAKTSHSIAELAKRRRSRPSGQTAPNDNDLKFAAVVWTNEAGMVLVARPLPIERAGWSSRVEIADHNCCPGLMNPRRTAMGIEV